MTGSLSMSIQLMPHLEAVLAQAVNSDILFIKIIFT